MTSDKPIPHAYLDERLDKMEQSILDALGIYAKQVDDRFDGIDTRLDGIDMRLDRIEHRLDQHDKEFRKLNKSYDHLV